MPRTHYEYLDEIEVILDKKAAAVEQGRREAEALFSVKLAEQALATDSMDGGSSTAMTATQGGGSAAHDGKTDLDAAGMEDPKHGDKSKGQESTAYQSGQPQSDSKDDVLHSGSVTGEKAARLGNDILQMLSKMTGTPQQKRAAGMTAAENVIARLAKMAEDESCPGEDEGVPEDVTNKDEVPGEGEGVEEYSDEEMTEATKAGKKSDEEKKAYCMSKRAGAIAAESLLHTLHQADQARMAKQAGYNVAGEMIKQAQMAQAQRQQAQFEDMVNRAVQEKLAAAGLTPSAAVGPVASNEALIQAEMRKIAADLAWADQARAAGASPGFPDRSHRVVAQNGHGATDLQKYAHAGEYAAEDVINRLAKDWFRKQADGGTYMANTILTGLVSDKTLSPEERDIVANKLVVEGAGGLDEEGIVRATEDVANKDAVREHLVKVLLQHNDNKAPSPVPAMPLSQVAPSTQSAGMSGAVSQTENPGGLDSIEKVVEAALRLRSQRAGVI